MTHSGSGGGQIARVPGGAQEEVGVNVTFHQWLASVTERINQTMHYQFDGHPKPLGIAFMNLNMCINAYTTLLAEFTFIITRNPENA